MSITISYKLKKYSSTHIVYRMKELILRNKTLLKVMANIYIMLDEEKKDENLINEENKEVIAMIVKKAIRSGWISKEVSKEFIELWSNINSEQLGLVLEQVISVIGPCETIYEDFDLSMEVEVEETKEKKNFDVVFF